MFVLNAYVSNAILSNNYDRKITDHKVIKVDLVVGLRQINVQASDITDPTNVSVKSLMAILKQGTIRGLANDSSTIDRLMNSVDGINRPAYEYFDRQTMEHEWSSNQVKKQKIVSYNSRRQTVREPEELELINELRKTEDIHNLTQMLRSGDMKGFYKTAERVLRVKPANPVVMKITTDSDEVIDDKDDVDRHIKQYFEAIYKAPD